MKEIDVGVCSVDELLSVSKKIQGDRNDFHVFRVRMRLQQELDVLNRYSSADEIKHCLKVRIALDDMERRLREKRT